MTEQADLATTLLTEATRTADRIGQSIDADTTDQLRAAGTVQGLAAVAAALLEVAAAIRDSGSPWHGSR
jgi:hypothetical protein